MITKVFYEERNDIEGRVEGGLKGKMKAASEGERITLMLDDKGDGEIRHYVTDADEAEERGHEEGDDEIIQNALRFHSARVTAFGNQITIVAFVQGGLLIEDGKNPDGRDQYDPFPNAYLDQPFKRVRIDLR